MEFWAMVMALQRLGRAFGFGLCALLGLLVSGVGPAVAFAVALTVWFCFALNVLGKQAGMAALGAVAWGALSAGGILPKAPDAPKALAAGFDRALKSVPSEPRQDRPGYVARLEQLRTACDQHLLTEQQCEAARTRILDEMTSGQSPVRYGEARSDEKR